MQLLSKVNIKVQKIKVARCLRLKPLFKMENYVHSVIIFGQVGWGCQENYTLGSSMILDLMAKCAAKSRISSARASSLVARW